MTIPINSHSLSKAAKIFATYDIRGREEQVGAIKKKAQELWALIDSINVVTDEARRMVAVSKTELEASIMWAVKAVSRYE